MEIAAPLTLADVKTQRIEIFGYKLAKDPKPGTKVMHAVETINHVSYGLAKQILIYVCHTTRITDLLPLIMVKYSHRHRTFEIQAPAVICNQAPQKLLFTVDSEKHGPLPYQLTRIDEYAQTPILDKSKNVIACIIEPTGKDVASTNDAAIELCFAEEAKRLGFCVTRFTRATTRTLKVPVNKFYCDLGSLTSAPPANALKFLKTINGPSGSPITVNFKEKSLTKFYKNLCPKCLAVTMHEKCACSKNKRKRGRSNSANKKAAKLARVIQTFENSYKVEG